MLYIKQMLRNKSKYVFALLVLTVVLITVIKVTNQRLVQNEVRDSMSLAIALSAPTLITQNSEVKPVVCKHPKFELKQICRSEYSVDVGGKPAQDYKKHLDLVTSNFEADGWKVHKRFRLEQNNTNTNISRYITKQFNKTKCKIEIGYNSNDIVTGTTSYSQQISCARDIPLFIFR